MFFSCTQAEQQTDPAWIMAGFIEPFTRELSNAWYQRAHCIGCSCLPLMIGVENSLRIGPAEIRHLPPIRRRKCQLF